MLLQQNYKLIQYADKKHIKYDQVFFQPTYGLKGFKGQFHQSFPKDYHQRGHIANNTYVKDAFKFGFYYSILHQRFELKKDIDYFLQVFEHSDILKKLGILYARNKILEEKTQTIIIYLDKLNIVLTLLINLLISCVQINSSSYDPIYIMIAIIKKEFYKNKYITINNFLEKIFPYFSRRTSHNRQIILLFHNVFEIIILYDLSALSDILDSFIYI